MKTGCFSQRHLVNVLSCFTRQDDIFSAFNPSFIENRNHLDYKEFQVLIWKCLWASPDCIHFLLVGSECLGAENLGPACQKSVISHLLILTIYGTLVLIGAIWKEILDKYIVKGRSLSQSINSVELLKSSESQRVGWKKAMAIKMAMKAINKGNSLHSWGFRSLISNYIAKIQKS